MMGKKNDPEKADTLAILVVPATAPDTRAMARDALKGTLPLLALLDPEERSHMLSPWIAAPVTTPLRTTSTVFPSSKPGTDGKLTRYGCLEIKNDFGSVTFDGRPEPYKLGKNTLARRCLRFLCEQGAVGPNGDFVPIDDIYERLKGDDDGSAKWQIRYAFKSKRVAPLLGAIEKYVTKERRYRIRAQVDEGQSAN